MDNCLSFTSDEEENVNETISAINSIDDKNIHIVQPDFDITQKLKEFENVKPDFLTKTIKTEVIEEGDNLYPSFTSKAVAKTNLKHLQHKEVRFEPHLLNSEKKVKKQRKRKILDNSDIKSKFNKKLTEQVKIVESTIRDGLCHTQLLLPKNISLLAVSTTTLTKQNSVLQGIFPIQKGVKVYELGDDSDINVKKLTQIQGKINLINLYIIHPFYNIV